MEPIIEFRGVTKSFPRQQIKPTLIKEALWSGLRGTRPTGDRFVALKAIDFTVRRGETVGLVGDNGSGKSTVLKLLTGILQPDGGKIAVLGKISPLLELGAGFHPDFTGRENVFLNGALLGLKKKEIEARFDEIVEFSELAEFIDQPVKTYSSGMYMRLAFSIATSIDPDILVIDEVLSVGDHAFQKKSFARIKQIQEQGKTILLVTHDQGMVNSLCDRAIWFEHGVIMGDGPAASVVEAYLNKGVEPKAAQSEPGMGELAVKEIAVRNQQGQAVEVVNHVDPFSVTVAWNASGTFEVDWRLSLIHAGDQAPAAASTRYKVGVLAGTPGSLVFVASAATLAAGHYMLLAEALRPASEQVLAKATTALYISSPWQRPAIGHFPGSWLDRTGELPGDGTFGALPGPYRREWLELAEAPRNDTTRLHGVALLADDGLAPAVITTDSAFQIAIEFEVTAESGFVGLTAIVSDATDTIVFSSINNRDPLWYGQALARGRYTSVCRVPGGLLNDRHYKLSLVVFGEDYADPVHEKNVLVFKVTDGPGARGDYAGEFAGTVRPVLDWQTRVARVKETT